MLVQVFDNEPEYLLYLKKIPELLVDNQYDASKGEKSLQKLEEIKSGSYSAFEFQFGGNSFRCNLLEIITLLENVNITELIKGAQFYGKSLANLQKMDLLGEKLNRWARRLSLSNPFYKWRQNTVKEECDSIESDLDHFEMMCRIHDIPSALEGLNNIRKFNLVAKEVTTSLQDLVEYNRNVDEVDEDTLQSYAETSGGNLPLLLNSLNEKAQELTVAHNAEITSIRTLLYHLNSITDQVVQLLPIHSRSIDLLRVYIGGVKSAVIGTELEHFNKTLKSMLVACEKHTNVEEKIESKLHKPVELVIKEWFMMG